MITFQNTDPQFDSLNRRLHEIADEMLDGLEPEEENALIEKGEILNSESVNGREMFFRITDGNPPALYGDRLLFHYECGDLVGIESMLGTAVTESRLELAVRADIFPKEKTLKKIRKDDRRNELLWEYFSVYSAIMQVLLGNSMAASRRPHFQLKHLSAGEIIIHQGATDTEVYSMVSGRAEVLVNEKKVGEVGENEVFGEMSRLTGKPRSATVRAKTDCDIMVFGGDDFNSLAESNPAALMDIARNLSERLKQLNTAVSGK